MSQFSFVFCFQLQLIPHKQQSLFIMQHRKKRVGKYVLFLDQQLGSGAYAQVFRGVDETTNQQVAIKVLKKQIIQEDQYTKQAFIQQIRIMKLLKSKNIIKFLDVHQTGHNYYIVQQIATDGSFDQLLDRTYGRRFNEATAIQFMTQILNGFGQMVKNGIVHRDMKPANILLKNGLIKIADFGFAKQSDNNCFLKTILGTPLYMSPQLLKSQEYTYKCDIWALGILFYQMLVGHTPWNWKNSSKKSWQYIKQTPLVFPTEYKISAQMKKLITGCLGYEENERYQWQQIYMCPLFIQKFKRNFEGVQKDSIRVAFLISDIRMAVHSQNIDMIRLIDQVSPNKQIHFQDFVKIFCLFEIPQQKMRILYQFCLFKIGSNSGTLTNNDLKQFLKMNGIRLNAFVPALQTDGMQLRKTSPASYLLRRLYTNIQRKKIDIYLIYKMEDKQKNNALQFRQFQILIKRIDPQIDTEQSQILFKQFDLNSDGKISFNEFRGLLCKIAGVPNIKQ